MSVGFCKIKGACCGKILIIEPNIEKKLNIIFYVNQCIHKSVVETNLHILNDKTKMIKAELQNFIKNVDSLENIEQHNPVKIRKRRRRISFDEANLSKEELQKLRREADAQRKKNRRREMTLEEREAFRRRENERKRRDRLQPSYDTQRAKENERKKEKRRTMSPAERQAFLKRDAERKRLERKRRREEALAYKNILQITSSLKTEPTEPKPQSELQKQIKIEYSEDMINNIKTSHERPIQQRKLGKPKKASERKFNPELQKITVSKSKDIVKMEMSTMMQEMMSLDYVNINAEEAKKDVLHETPLLVPLSYAIGNECDENSLHNESLVLPMEDTSAEVFNDLLNFETSGSKSITFEDSTMIPASNNETVVVPSEEEKQLNQPMVLELIESAVLFEDIDCLNDMFDTNSAECQSNVSVNEEHLVQLDKIQDENLVLEFLPNQYAAPIFNPLAANVDIFEPDEKKEEILEPFIENFVITLLPDQKKRKNYTFVEDNLSSSMIVNSKEQQIDTTLGKKLTLLGEKKFETLNKSISPSIVIVPDQKLTKSDYINETAPSTLWNQQQSIYDCEKLSTPISLQLTTAEHSVQNEVMLSAKKEGKQSMGEKNEKQDVQADNKPIGKRNNADDETLYIYIFGQSGHKALYSLSQVNNGTVDLKYNQNMSRRENGWHWAYTALWRQQQRPDYFNVSELLNNCPIINDETKGNNRLNTDHELQPNVLLEEEKQLRRRYSEPSVEIGDKRYIFDGHIYSSHFPLFKDKFRGKYLQAVSENIFLPPVLQNEMDVKICSENQSASAAGINGLENKEQKAARLQKRISSMKINKKNLSSFYSSHKKPLSNLLQETKFKILQAKCNELLGVRSSSMHSEYCKPMKKSHLVVDIDLFDQIKEAKILEHTETPSLFKKLISTHSLPAKTCEVMTKTTKRHWKIINNKNKYEIRKKRRNSKIFKSISKHSYKSAHFDDTTSQALSCFQKSAEDIHNADSTSITSDLKYAIILQDENISQSTLDKVRFNRHSSTVSIEPVVTEVQKSTKLECGFKYNPLMLSASEFSHFNSGKNEIQEIWNLHCANKRTLLGQSFYKESVIQLNNNCTAECQRKKSCNIHDERYLASLENLANLVEDHEPLADKINVTINKQHEVLATTLKILPDDIVLIEHMNTHNLPELSNEIADELPAELLNEKMIIKTEDLKKKINVKIYG